jgi:succinate dehydrogenase/fumarate reductase flavoprotein subunit
MEVRMTVDQRIDTDVLVIGGGLAGTFAAIKAKEAGAEKVTLVSKGLLGKDSISTFAAGVWKMILPEDDKDEELKKYASGYAFSEGLYDEEWLNVYLADNYARVMDMAKYGVDWQKTPDGKFERIEMRWKIKMGMFPGPRMMEVMAKKVKDSAIQVIGHTMMTDLLIEKGTGERVIGAVGFDVRTGEFKVFKARSTVLAAGGCGFKGRFSCHKFQTGEASAMAYRAGAELGNFEIGGDRSHTTAMAFDIQGLNMFVGLGGHFVNAEGERFMLEYDPELNDYAGMSRVSEAGAMEIRAGRGPIYLDMSHFTPAQVQKLRKVVPIPTKIMERAGVIVGDRIVRRMEWGPAFFGTLGEGGGVMANTRCETSLPGLYACGDAKQRANVMDGSLTGAAISGARAGVFAAEYARGVKESVIDEGQVERFKKSAFEPLERKEGNEPHHIIIGINETLIPYEISLLARADRLERAIEEIERIRDEEVPLLYATDAHCLRLANEARSMVLVAEMYLRSRLLREESRNGCLREDYPYTDNVNWLKWTKLKQGDGKMKVWTEDLPVEKYKVKPKRYKHLYPVFEVASKRGIKWG